MELITTTDWWEGLVSTQLQPHLLSALQELAPLFVASCAIVVVWSYLREQ